MELNDYQIKAMQTEPAEMSKKDNLALCGLGVAGEAGEVAELIKKHLYHPHVMIIEADIIDEMGDVLWYLAFLAEVLGTDLETVARANIGKLLARYPQGFPKQTLDTELDSEF